MAIDQPTCDLGGGVRMPMLGLGTAGLTGNAAEQAVEWALEAGYRHFDTAAMYRNERSVGAAVRRSAIRRDEVFVTTKLLPAHPDAARALESSLKRLGLDYVDLYLIHWPMPILVDRQWRQLQALQARGLARSIGVSNFSQPRLAALVASGAPAPAVNQVQFSPLHYRKGILEYCKERGVVLEAYSPLERGQALGDPVIADIARRSDRSTAQVMLRWAVQHGAVVIPKSGKKERIHSNGQIFDFELSESDMGALDALDVTGGTGSAQGPRRSRQRA